MLLCASSRLALAFIFSLIGLNWYEIGEGSVGELSKIDVR